MLSNTQSSAKKLNEMNRLADMGHFPALVHLGATTNVLCMVALTWIVVLRYPQPMAPVLWIAIILACNLLPVILLRLSLTPQTPYPSLANMDFVRDQHKFSDWVYVAASANMAFWVLTSWALFSRLHTPLSLGAMLAVALAATFSPVLIRKPRM
jgi:hypothetical protein